MTQDEIIEMARQAGFFINDELTITSPFIEDICISPMLKEFAKLVAAKERERVEDLCMRGTQLAVLVAKAEECEACAKFAAEFMQEHEGVTFGIDKAIRARGEA